MTCISWDWIPAYGSVPHQFIDSTWSFPHNIKSPEVMCFPTYDFITSSWSWKSLWVLFNKQMDKAVLKQLSHSLARMNQRKIPGKYKVCCYQLYHKVMWPLKYCEIPCEITTASKIDGKSQRIHLKVLQKVLHWTWLGRSSVAQDQKRTENSGRISSLQKWQDWSKSGIRLRLCLLI